MRWVWVYILVNLYSHIMLSCMCGRFCPTKHDHRRNKIIAPFAPFVRRSTKLKQKKKKKTGQAKALHENTRASRTYRRTKDSAIITREGSEAENIHEVTLEKSGLGPRAPHTNTTAAAAAGSLAEKTGRERPVVESPSRQTDWLSGRVDRRFAPASDF